MKKNILTVTLNPALDKTVFVKDLRWGQTIISDKETVTAGGKGVNVSRILTVLGRQTLATGLCGGTTGKRIQSLLKQEGIRFDFVEINGVSRVNTTIIDSMSRRNTRILGAGPKVTKSQVEKFKKKYRKHLQKSCIVILSGRNANGVKDGFYADLIRMAAGQRVATVLDTSGLPLRLGAKAGPLIIKPNINEAQEVLGCPLKTLTDIKKGIKRFHRWGVRIVLLSLGSRGAIGSDGCTMWQAIPPREKGICDVGCGDAFMGGFIDSFCSHKFLKESMGFAVAMGTAYLRKNALQHFPQSEFKRLLNAITIKKL